MKKVLIVHDYFFLGPISGGPFNSVLGLYKYLNRHFKTEILSIKDDNYNNQIFITLKDWKNL